MVMGFSLYLLVLFAGLALSSPWVQAQQGRTLPHMTSDFSEVAGKSFDYIIVGGGAAGCPLAATLSEKFSVLLVERGDSPFGNPLVTDTRTYGLSLLQPNEYTSIVQNFTTTEGATLLRGRVLGGSTSINGGFYSRASEETVERLGLDKDKVLDAYEWVESKVVYDTELSKWQRVVRSSYLEAGVFPYNGFTLDHIEGTKVGGSMFDDWERRHTAANLLEYAANPDNIVILLNATVQSVILHTKGKRRNQPVARGIRFIKSDGSDNSTETYEAYLNLPKRSGSSGGDVILAAGALGSPQLLLLSGIGPREQLENFNISVAVDLETVGKGLNDNPTMVLLADPNGLFFPSEPTKVVAIADDSYLIVESAILPTNIYGNATRMPLSGKLAFFESQGSLELNNTDPRKNPSVTFNYLSTENDLAGCVKLVQLIERIANSKSIASYLGAQNTLQNATDDELRTLCKENVTTFYHYHGGALRGSVVDKDYKVYGVKGLRVVDGSTLLESPGTNPVATVMMLGRYQGLNILQERNERKPMTVPDLPDQQLVSDS